MRARHYTQTQDYEARCHDSGQAFADLRPLGGEAVLMLVTAQRRANSKKNLERHWVSAIRGIEGCGL